MREILFRGKTVSESEYLDGGEWIEGFYTRFNGEEHRIYTGYAETDCVDYCPDWFNVIPETVGQYTGLTDKNGKKIFEGDILNCVTSDFDGSDKYVYNYEITDITDFQQMGFLDFCNVIEVIGNIHDNPELIGGD